MSLRSDHLAQMASIIYIPSITNVVANTAALFPRRSAKFLKIFLKSMVFTVGAVKLVEYATVSGSSVAARRRLDDEGVLQSHIGDPIVEFSLT